MKRLAKMVIALAFASFAILAVGCSESADPYDVYKIDRYKDQGVMEYDVVYYKPGSTSLGDTLSGYVDESHFEKSKWSEDQVKETIAKSYPDIDSMDFVKSSFTDEGDYYCTIVEFDKLDKLDTLTTLYQHGTLFSRGIDITGKGAVADPDAQADKQVGASFFRSSLGGTKVEEKDIDALEMHYFAKQAQ